ncbi:MAG: threonine synthase [Phycisphaerales bacterium]
MTDPHESTPLQILPSPVPKPPGAPEWQLACVECGRMYAGLDVRYRCDCSGTLEVRHDLVRLWGKLRFSMFDARLASRVPADRSGVWRFRELILPLEEQHIVTRGEGNTTLYHIAEGNPLSRYAGVRELRFKHEGENPTGSFKDRGMTTGVSMAKRLGMTRVACASTGNTSASMASYAAIAGMRAVVFIPEGNISFGKLSQALAYGARTVQIRGDFDDAMRLVEEVSRREGIYLLNSLNPFRLEGQKAIALELLQDLDWQPPDWIVVPGGNLGNNSAIYKGVSELHCLGLLHHLPRLAVIQAAGANPLYRAFSTGAERVEPIKNADTIATAIRIGNPVSATKSMRAIKETRGVVEQVTDQETMDAKAMIDAAGIGAEPASCVTVAGLRKLTAAGVIGPDEKIVCILTGHVLKDSDSTAKYHQGKLPGFTTAHANAPVVCDAGIDSVLRAIG